jgi:hypothetical protein
VAELLTGERFRELFTSFEHSADKLETRDRYTSPIEDEAVRQFLDGEPLDLTWLDRWFGMVRTATRAGKRFSRVRVVSEPLSDYKRFEMAVAPHTVAAGEDIRYLSRPEAEALEVPEQDFWILDQTRLALLHFDDGDGFLGGELVDDQAAVERHRRWFEKAQAAAIPFAEYVRTRLEAQQAEPPG